MNDASQVAPPPSLGKLFWVFLVMGATSLGGGVVAYLRTGLVVRQRWLDDLTFVELLSISQTLPGLNATNMSILVGDRLRGGVSVAGISNFVTFLQNTSAYRRDLRRAEYGDERDPRTRAVLQRVSPLTNAAMIRKPLLVVQGLNDPRVPASESEQMVQKVRGNRGEVWYLAAKDEGHGFRKKTNRDFYLKTFASFLAKLKG